MLISFLQGELNVVEFLTDMLVSLPGIILALTLHEAAHGYVAFRCGDPTAMRMGRVSLNPLRHLDPMGFLSMIAIGVGWAKPVPVNPNNFKKPRRDDLLVSMAGITANILQFAVGIVIVMAFIGAALGAIPPENYAADGYFTISTSLRRYRMLPSEAYLYAANMRLFLIEPVFGTVAGYVFEVFVNFAVTNVVLACFNLLPIPPLDGYHLFNDLIFKRQLFAPVKAQRIGQALVLLLALTGMLSRGLSFVVNGAFEGAGMLFSALFAVA
ncbi:MAG: site-2 protease family protein [Clostridia bacterium]|nr:site-2 protease family protein [Clostridia bacterium]